MTCCCPLLAISDVQCCPLLPIVDGTGTGTDNTGIRSVGTGTGTEGTDSTSTDAYDIGTILSRSH